MPSWAMTRTDRHAKSNKSPGDFSGAFLCRSVYRLGGKLPPRSFPKAITQSRCSSVSGTVKPCEARISASASSASIPEQIIAQAATSEDRPIPARQWIAIERPSPTPAASRRAITEVSCSELGNPRSGIGKEIKSMPLARHRSVSLCSPSSEISSCSKRLTTTSTPEFRHSLTSAASQSSARGRAIMASRPAARISIQCNRDIQRPPPNVRSISRRVLMVSSSALISTSSQLTAAPWATSRFNFR